MALLDVQDVHSLRKIAHINRVITDLLLHLSYRHTPGVHQEPVYRLVVAAFNPKVLAGWVGGMMECSPVHSLNMRGRTTFLDGIRIRFKIVLSTSFAPTILPINHWHLTIWLMMTRCFSARNLPDMYHLHLRYAWQERPHFFRIE